MLGPRTTSRSHTYCLQLLLLWTPSKNCVQYISAFKVTSTTLVPRHYSQWESCAFFIFKHTFYRSTGELYIGGIKSHTYNDNRCIADIGNKETVPGLYNCKEAMQKGMGIYWDFGQVLQKSIITGWIWDGWFGLKYHLERWCGGEAALMTCVFFSGQRIEEQTDKKVPWDKK